MLKALEILKEKREICVRIFEGDDYSDGLDYYENKIIKLDEAIAELEALENRSCSNCKHHIDTSKLSDEEYLSLIDKCMRCKHYYNDNWEPK